jgi:hypothetical protein
MDLGHGDFRPHVCFRPHERCIRRGAKLALLDQCPGRRSEATETTETNAIGMPSTTSATVQSFTAWRALAPATEPALPRLSALPDSDCRISPRRCTGGSTTPRRASPGENGGL